MKKQKLCNKRKLVFISFRLFWWQKATKSFKCLCLSKKKLYKMLKIFTKLLSVFLCALSLQNIYLSSKRRREFFHIFMLSKLKNSLIICERKSLLFTFTFSIKPKWNVTWSFEIWIKLPETNVLFRENVFAFWIELSWCEIDFHDPLKFSSLNASNFTLIWLLMWSYILFF